MMKLRLAVLALLTIVPTGWLAGEVRAQETPNRPGLAELAPERQGSQRPHRNRDSILIHVKARDGILQEHATLSSISDFQQRAVRQLTEYFSNPNVGDGIRDRVARELERLEREEAALTNADAEARTRALERFDQGFPVDLGTRSSALEAPSVFTLLRRDANALQSGNNNFVRRQLAEMEKVFADSEQKSRSNNRAQIEAVLRLPRMFHDLANKTSFADMTPQDSTNAIARYRTVLVSLRDGSGITTDERRDISEDIRRRLAIIGVETTKEFDRLNWDITKIQEEMINTAERTFNSGVSESSFLYLIGVFAFIFVVMMLAPRLYRDPENSVAKALLKSDFLLQFSTVFVLTSSILVLGIGGFIKEDQLPVLLAGISGYVLGQLGRSAVTAQPAA